MKSSDLHGNFS